MRFMTTLVGGEAEKSVVVGTIVAEVVCSDDDIGDEQHQLSKPKSNPI